MSIQSLSLPREISARLITFMGDDTLVANAARVSHAKHVDACGPDEERIIAYMARNGHWTPFSHPQATFRITAPLYVAAQLKRHVIGFSLNEISRRYVKDSPTFYKPKPWRKAPPKNIKQGSGDPFTSKQCEVIDSIFNRCMNDCEETYERLLDYGVAPELARSVLPTATFTQWYWTGSLAAWARLCELRISDHAQAETRMVAQQVSDALVDLFPISWRELRRPRWTPPAAVQYESTPGTFRAKLSAAWRRLTGN